MQTLSAAELAALGGEVSHTFGDDEDGPVNATLRTIAVMADDDDGGSMCSVPAVGRWMIVNPAGDQDMVPGMKFNVLVINP